MTDPRSFKSLVLAAAAAAAAATAAVSAITTLALFVTGDTPAGALAPCLRTWLRSAKRKLLYNHTSMRAMRSIRSGYPYAQGEHHLLLTALALSMRELHVRI